MASTSTARAGGGAATRIKEVTSTLASDNQIIADIKKTLNSMKEIAVEMEKLNRTEEVTKLENAFMELLETFDESMVFSNVMQSVGNNYQPGSESTNFKKLFKSEVSKIKGGNTSNRQTTAMLRQFKEAIWNVHHAGQPMPGEEEEDIVMTSIQGISNTVCPISGKSITDLAEPVRSKDCKHVYDKIAILQYLKQSSKKCPVAGCPKSLSANQVVCDPLLLVEIEELRTQNNNTVQTEGIEDFTTALDDED